MEENGKSGESEGRSEVEDDGEVRGGELGEQEMGSGTWRGCTEMEMEVALRERGDSGDTANLSGGGGGLRR